MSSPAEVLFIEDFAQRTFSHKFCNHQEYMDKLLNNYHAAYTELVTVEDQATSAYNNASESRRRSLKEAMKKAKIDRKELEDGKVGEMIMFQERYVVNGKQQPRYIIVAIPNCDSTDQHKVKPLQWLRKIGALAFPFFREGGMRYDADAAPKVEPIAHLAFILDSVTRCIYAAAPAFLTKDKNGATCGAKNQHPYHWIILSPEIAQRAIDVYAPNTPNPKTFIECMTAKTSVNDWAWTISAPTSQMNTIKARLIKKSCPTSNDDDDDDGESTESGNEETTAKDDGDDDNDDDNKVVTYSSLNKSFESSGKITHDQPKYVSPASPTKVVKPVAFTLTRVITPVDGQKTSQKRQRTSSSSSSSSSTQSSTIVLQDLHAILADDEDSISSSVLDEMHAHITARINDVSSSYVRHITDGRHNDAKIFTSDPNHSMAQMHVSCKAGADVELPPQVWAALAYLRRNKDDKLRTDIESAGELFQKARTDWAKGALTATRANMISPTQAGLHRAIILASADGIRQYETALTSVIRPKLQAIEHVYTSLQMRFDQQEERFRLLEEELQLKSAHIDEGRERENAMQLVIAGLKEELSNREQHHQQQIDEYQVKIEALSKANEAPMGDADF